MIFAAAAVAGKILRLNAQQIRYALAFNRSGGSFQSNIDGSLALRLIQGVVSQGWIICAQLAQRGITDPKTFLKGVYSCFHLYAKDKHNPQGAMVGRGERFELAKTVFKKYPSCGSTLASTDAVLDLVKEKGLVPEDLTRIDIQVTPYIHKLVGHPFKVGGNPKVDAQFSIQYCVANTLLRKGSKLRHFDETSIREPKIMELVNKIHVSPDPALEERGHTAVDMDVTTKGGEVLHKSVDIACNFPGNALPQEEHHKRFQDCVSCAGTPLPPENVEKVVLLVSQLEDLMDVRSLIPLLLSQGQKAERS
jgi:2-methylcitrate dehydratase PrpD